MVQAKTSDFQPLPLKILNVLSLLAGAYHLALLRQVLENIASFLGVGQFQYVLQQIGFTEESGRMADIINALTHQKVYYPQVGVMVPDNKQILIDVYNALMGKYHFVLHN